MRSFYRDRPVLVTGATGLLGSWLVGALLDQEAEVVCLVRDWVPQSELIRSGSLEKVKVARGDVRDGPLIERVLAEYEVATVFHLAAQTIVGIANRNPLSTFETNIGGTWSLMEACRRSPAVKEIVVASSDKAYGNQAVLPYTEATPLSGKHPYDVSKSCADLIVQAYAATYDSPVCITRCGNLYGGGDLNWNRIVPGTIRSVCRDESPIIRSDGTYVRDYFFVEDAAAAYMLLASRMAEQPELRGRAFNFSYGKPLTVLQVVNEILRIMRANVKPRILSEASNEIREQYLDAARAREMLGWTPRFGLEEGIKRTISWYRNLFEKNPVEA